MVVVPSIERVPLTVAVDPAGIVLTPLPLNVTLLKVVVPVKVCAAPLKITVAVPGLKTPVPPMVHPPLTVKLTGLTGSIVRDAPA